MKWDQVGQVGHGISTALYIERVRDETEKSHTKMPCKGKIPQENGFLQGTNASGNGA